MARTRAQWEALIESNEILASLTGSAVAEWLEIRRFVITIAMAIEYITDMFKADVNDTIYKSKVGLITWWPFMIKQFQYGDSLTVINGVPQYTVIDATKQIVTHVAVNEIIPSSDLPGAMIVLEIKVAKTVAGLLAQLDNTELTALKVYAKQRRPPGVSINIISRPADSVKHTTTIKYDGAYSLTDIQTAVDAALLDFRDNYVQFEDGMFYKSQLIARLRDIPGVISVVTIIDMSLNSGTQTVTNLVEEQVLPAGYFVWDATSSTSLTAI